MANPTKVKAARNDLKELAGPSGFGSVAAEERKLKAADAGTTYAGWDGPTGVTGRGGPRGATGPTGPAGA